MSTDAELQSYLAEARTWDADRVAQMRRSTRVAWTMAASGWLGMTGLAAALMMLMPLQRIEPFVIRVDNSTGIVDVVPTYTGQSQIEEPVTRYFLTHYLSVCERFNFATAESDYEECGAFHSAARNQEWSALWARSNPASPLNVHRNGETVRVQVRSVTFFQRANGISDLAQLRYLKMEREGSGIERPSYWIATIQFAYGEPSQDVKARAWNPLGFRVVEFKSEPEITAHGELPVSTIPDRGPLS